MKKIVFILIGFLILNGCAQPDKQKPQQKTEAQTDVGFAVRVGLQSEQGLPVQLKLEEGPLPVELLLQDSQRFPVDIAAEGALPVKVQWQENESRPVNVSIAGDKKLAVKLDLEDGQPLPVTFEVPKIHPKLIAAAVVMVLSLLVTALAALLAAVFAWRAAKYSKQNIRK